jgi:copper chaperone CopZ
MSESISLNVNGMKCGGCEANIKNKLSNLPGILSVEPSHLNKQVEVTFDPDTIDVETIEDAIIDAGFSIE